MNLNAPEYDKFAYSNNGKPGSMSLLDALRLYFRTTAADEGTVYAPLLIFTSPYLLPLVRLLANAYPDKKLARHKEVSVAAFSCGPLTGALCSCAPRGAGCSGVEEHRGAVDASLNKLASVWSCALLCACLHAQLPNRIRPPS